MMFAQPSAGLIQQDQQDMNMMQPYIVAMLVPVAMAQQLQEGAMVMAAPAQEYPQEYAVNQWVPVNQEAITWNASEPLQPEGSGSSSHYTSLRTYSGDMDNQQDFFDEEDICSYDYSDHRSQGFSRRRRRQRLQPKAPGMLEPVRRPAPTQAMWEFTPERCAQLREQLEAGDPDEMSSALDAITENVWPLSRDVIGCRVVQLALEKVDISTAKTLAAELRGHVREAATSPHANYVLQKVITGLPAASSCFIAEELCGNGARFARHRFGCRILCRLMEHCAKEEGTVQLIDEVLDDAAEALDLCRHSFGHHVVQSVLEHSCDRHKDYLADVLRQDLHGNATHRSASYVVEAALCHCSAEDQQSLLQELTLPGIVADLAQSRFGFFVARALLQRPEVDAEALSQAIPAVAALMVST